MLLLAARLLFLGLWLVVPFLLIDVLAVAAAFYLIRRNSRIYESIDIDDATLEIHHHEVLRAKSWSFDIHWVKINLQERGHPWQATRLLVGSHGKWIEFANFLTDEERVSLSRALKLSIQTQLHNV